MKDWTIVRIRGARGAPSLDATQFLGCVAAVREDLASTRWHYKWLLRNGRTEYDGLRVELPYGSKACKAVVARFESHVPPPDSVVSEPLRPETDLDPVQAEAELDFCLDLLWRYSELILDLRMRNTAIQARQIQGLTPGALLTFVTGDRRHFERALESSGVGQLPAVAFSRFMELVNGASLTYRIPPVSRDEAVSSARIHHLAGCTFAAEFYPFTRAP
jgi:hypothetical protein